MSSLSSSSGQRLPWMLGALALVVAVLYLARVVLIPLAFAVLVSFVLAPIVSDIQRRTRLARLPAVLLVVGLALAVVLGLAFVFLNQVTELAAELPEYKTQIAGKLQGLSQMAHDLGITHVFGVFNDLSEGLNGAAWPAEDNPDPLPVKVTNSNLPALTLVVGSALDFLVQAGLVVLLVTFILLHREDLRNRIFRLWGQINVLHTTKVLDDAGGRISRFLLMQLVVNVSYGAVLALGLWIIGVPYAATWGMLAAALRYIPYVGPWIAALMPVALTLAVFPTWSQVILVVVFIVVLELVSNNVMEPVLYGHTIGVSEIALLIAAVFWTWLWGPAGLMLSTPLTACLAVLGRYVPRLEFLDTLLGDSPVLDPAVAYYQRLLARDQDEAANLIEEDLKIRSGDAVHDEVLVPALVLAKRDLAQGQLESADMRFILEATREILFDQVVPHEQARRTTRATIAPRSKQVLVWGLPAEDDADELALHFLRQMTGATDHFEVLPASTLLGEVVSRMKEDMPVVLCIGSVPQNRIARLRFLCKRFRGIFPDLKIVVGCWGLKTDSDLIGTKLRAAGADFVGLSLHESRDQLLPLLTLEPSNEPGQQRAAPALADR